MTATPASRETTSFSPLFKVALQRRLRMPVSDHDSACGMCGEFWTGEVTTPSWTGPGGGGGGSVWFFVVTSRVRYSVARAFPSHLASSVHLLSAHVRMWSASFKRGFGRLLLQSFTSALVHCRLLPDFVRVFVLSDLVAVSAAQFLSSLTPPWFVFSPRYRSLRRASPASPSVAGSTHRARFFAAFGHLDLLARLCDFSTSERFAPRR